MLSDFAVVHLNAGGRFVPGRMRLLMDSGLIAAAATEPSVGTFPPCPPNGGRRGEMRWLLSGRRQAIPAARCK